MERRYLLPVALSVLVFALCGCSQSTQEMQPGYYTAEAEGYDVHGWKAFVTIYVSGDKIVTVDYDARDANGLLRSWDVNFMAEMYEAQGVYPNRYTREYTSSLLNRQSLDRVDAVTGATYSQTSFRLLTEAAIQRAKAGDRSIARVELPGLEEFGGSAA